MPLRVLFLTDNFPPESNAPANRTYEHCKEWVKSGAKVTVITCHPNFPKGKLFPGYKNKLYSIESMDGIKVIRVWSYITPNRGTIKRIFDYLSFSFSSFIASLFVRTDIIVATSPQLFTALGGYLASIFKGKPWVMEVRDLWPESIVAVDAMNSSKILDKLQSFVDFLYRKATILVVVTDSFKKKIVSTGIKSEKIRVVKNGVNTDRFQPLEKNSEIISQLGLESKFIVGYIGTHGMAHDLDFVLDCAKQIADAQVHFLFIGDGAMKNRLFNRKVSENIGNVTMLNSVPREKVSDYISILDVSLISLKKTDTFKSVIPSKIFENAAMCKPILLGVEGESKQIIEEYEVGACYEPGNLQDFVKHLTLLKDNKEFFARCGSNGKALATDFDRKVLADRMLIYLQRVVREKRLKSIVFRRLRSSLILRIMILLVDVSLFIAMIAVILSILIW